MRRAGILKRIAVVALALSLASAGAAQNMSAGYKFLDAVKKRDGTAVETMISNSGAKGTRGDIIINSRDITSGDSALHLVIAGHDYKWLEYLLYKGADANNRNFGGTTPLWLAINSGFSDGAILLISKGARVNDPGPSGETPLISAVHQRNVDLVRVLIKAGADVTRADNSGRNPMDYAKLANAGMISSELDAAAKVAKAKKQSYGPSF